ncbi:MAG: twin-arginine translocase subunit TatA [Gammaproteobacteria bacterium]|nr:twin-arginine translocase subunit TatA [Gammaproteobacteria bacterium]HBW84723.1 Sec-independent protein translocase subunit TatA [Gammaproteobacteria bacterium]|tara:strand:+ start:2538 stop:2768 length:231 start_codon:yes stop_codon:yes gene_type:complete
MGLGGIGIWQLLIILLIVFMLFGTKKLRSLGSDLGGALKGFKTAMKDEGTPTASNDSEEASGETIEATAEKVETKS